MNERRTLLEKKQRENVNEIETQTLEKGNSQTKKITWT